MNADQAKAAGDAMAALWESEFGATSQVLAAVKDDNRNYKPDPKSRSAWELAVHLATADVWFADSIANGKFEWDPEGEKKAAAQFDTVQDVVAFYQQAFPAKLQQLRGLTGDKMAESLDFFGSFKMTRAQFIGFANNHSVHHRGQLAAYLRALGSKVPNIYGPSADAEKAST
jgi:uncharacterized damage-inducible protein DinB